MPNDLEERLTKLLHAAQIVLVAKANCQEDWELIDLIEDVWADIHAWEGMKALCEAMQQEQDRLDDEVLKNRVEIGTDKDGIIRIYIGG